MRYRPRLFKIKDGKIYLRKKYKKITIVDLTGQLIDFSDLDFSTMEFKYKEGTNENISKS